MTSFSQGALRLKVPEDVKARGFKLALGVAAAVFWSALPAPASAAPTGVIVGVGRARLAASASVTSRLSAWKVEQKDGAEKLVEAGKVAPGDVIEYRVEYRNTGSRDVRDLVATLPIPEAMSYVERSSRPAQAQGSTNGRTFGPLPLRRRVKSADGSVSVVAVPSSQYRFLRWNVPVLGAGQSISFAARARVNR